MTRTTLLALAAAALLARLVAALLLGGSYHFMDEVLYADAAHRLTEGLGFAEDYGQAPGLAMLLAALPDPRSTSPLVSRLQLATLAVLGCWLLYLLAHRTGGREAAVVAVALYALDPLLVVSAGLLYPEATGAVLLLAIVLLTERAARTDSLRSALGAGALLGVMALFRPVALVLAPVIATWTAWNVGGAAKPALRRRVAIGTTMIVACGLVLVPWTYRNYRVHGGLVPITTMGATGSNLGPVESEDVESLGLVRALTRRTFTEPWDVARRTGRSFMQFWELYPTRLAVDNPVRRAELNQVDERVPLQETFPRSLRDIVSVLSFGPELVLALVGLVVTWRRDRRATALLLGTILAFALGYALFVAKVRYRIPILPVMFVFSGVGAVACYHWLLGRRRFRLPRP